MEYNDEPVIGHHIGAEVYEPDETELDRALQKLRTNPPFDQSPRDRRRIKIEVGDVDWDETKTVNMKVEDFDKLVDWYLENVR